MILSEEILSWALMGVKGLSALQRNRTLSRLLYLFYNKESIKFPMLCFQFSKQTLGDKL